MPRKASVASPAVPARRLDALTFHVWRDVSSYSYTDKERVPSVFEYKTPVLRLSVHRHMDGAKDDWFLSCREAGFDKKLLTAKGIEEAKAEALERVKSHLAALLASL